MTAGSLPRAMILMDILAAASPAGVGIAALVERSGLPRATVYRVLGTLMDAGWVERRADDRYHFGTGFAAIAGAAAAHPPLDTIAAADLAGLRDRLRHTVYLSVRSGQDSVCIARYETDDIIKMLVLTVGARQPLGLGAGGLALLSALDAEAADRIIDANLARYRDRAAFDEPVFRQALADARRHGFAQHVGLFTAGVAGIGVPVFDGAGRPIAAISTAFLADWFEPGDYARTARQMQDTAAAIRARL